MGKFFKRFIAIVGVIALIGTTFVSCQKETTNKNDEGLQTIRLNEVVRSVFYSGLYVSISEGFFEEEGIKIDLSTGQGADKTMQQLLSGNVDIGCDEYSIVEWCSLRWFGKEIAPTWSDDGMIIMYKVFCMDVDGTDLEHSSQSSP